MALPADLRPEFELIEARLGPVIRRPLVIDGRRNPAVPIPRLHPLDEAGVRGERDRLAERLRSLYPVSSISDRESIRLLFKDFRAVRWAMWPKTKGAETTAGLRNCLLHLAMTDGA